MFFSPQAPYFSMTSPSGSLSSGNFSAYLSRKLQCDAVESLLTPTTAAPSFDSFGSAALNACASRVCSWAAF